MQVSRAGDDVDWAMQCLERIDRAKLFRGNAETRIELEKQELSRDVGQHSKLS